MLQVATLGISTDSATTKQNNPEGSNGRAITVTPTFTQAAPAQATSH